MNRVVPKNISPIIALTMGLSACAAQPEISYKKPDGTKILFKTPEEKESFLKGLALGRGIEREKKEKAHKETVQELAKERQKNRELTNTKLASMGRNELVRFSIPLPTERKIIKKNKELTVIPSRKDAMSPALKPLLIAVVENTVRQHKGKLTLMPMLVFKETAIGGAVKVSLLVSVQAEEKTFPIQKFKIATYRGSFNLQLLRFQAPFNNLPKEVLKNLNEFLKKRYEENLVY